MGSHLSCFLHKTGNKSSSEELYLAPPSGKRTQGNGGAGGGGDDNDGDSSLNNHRRILQHHLDVLKRTIDPKGFLLLELLARDVLEDRDRQWIKAEKKDVDMNLRLIGWLVENDAHTYSVFLDSLRASHQEHIANLLEGKEGDRVLTEDELHRVIKVEPLLAVLIDAKVGLVDVLYSCKAITKTDYQRICVRSTDHQINKKLFKVLMRSSDITWQAFFEGLVETKQSHLLKYFDHGEILSAKVDMLPHSCRHVVKEQAIMDHVNDITSNLHSTPVSKYIDDNRLMTELVKINVECVCVHVDTYIVFYFYSPTVTSLNQLWILYQCGRLQGLIGDLFNMKSLEVQHAQFRVTMSKNEYKICRKQLETSGSTSFVNLRAASSSNKSKSASIHQMPIPVLDLILQKAAKLMITTTATVAPSTSGMMKKAQIYRTMSSVCSSWKKVLSDERFVDRLRLELSTNDEF